MCCRLFQRFATFMAAFNILIFAGVLSKAATVAEDFRAFLARPPIIKNLIFSASPWPGLNTNACIECRWQPDAVLWLEFESEKDARLPTPEKALRGWAYYKNKFWEYSRTLGVTTYVLPPNTDQKNPAIGIVSGCYGALGNMSWPLEAGVPNIPIGEIKWSGNSFFGANSDHRISRSGVLYTEDGFPKTMVVTGSSDFGRLDAILKYSYDSQHNNAYPLPSTIEIKLKQGELYVFNMIEIETSSGPLSEKYFSLDAMMPGNVTRYDEISETKRFLLTPDGRKSLVALSVPENPAPLKLFIIRTLVFFVSTGLAYLFFVNSFPKNSKNKLKATEKSGFFDVSSG